MYVEGYLYIQYCWSLFSSITDTSPSKSFWLMYLQFSQQNLDVKLRQRYGVFVFWASIEVGFKSLVTLGKHLISPLSKNYTGQSWLWYIYSINSIKTIGVQKKHMYLHVPHKQEEAYTKNFLSFPLYLTQLEILVLRIISY